MSDPISNLRLFHDIDGRDIALTSTPAAVATLPVGNLLVPEREDIARWLAPSVEIVGRYPSSRIIDSLALSRTNLSSQAAVRLEVFADHDLTVPLYDSGALPPYPVLGWGEFGWGAPIGAGVYHDWPQVFTTVTFEPVACMAWRLTVSDPENPQARIDIGRAIAGLSWAPKYNTGGISIEWADDGKQARTAGSSLITEGDVEPYRRVDIPLEVLTQADRARLSEIGRKLGTRWDFFLICYRDAAESELARDGALQGKFTAIPKLAHAGRDEFTSQLNIEEC